MEVTSQLIALLEHLGARSIELKTETSRPELGDKLLCTCPLHEDNSPSFMLRVQEPFLWNCFVCGAGRGLPELVMNSQLYEGCKRPDAKRIADQYVDLTQARLRAEKTEAPQVEPLDEVYTAAYSGLVNEAYKYMVSRGFTEEFARQNGVGYDRYRRRITIPIRNRSGKLMAFVGRTTMDRETLKAHNARRKEHGLPPSQRYYVYDHRPVHSLMLGLEHLESKYSKVIICEGAFDYLRLRSFGAHNVLAILGSKVSQQQLDILTDFNRPVYAFLDNDEAGAAGVLKLIEDLNGKLPVYVPPYEEQDSDPGDMTGARFAHLVKNSKPPYARKLKEFT